MTARYRLTPRAGEGLLRIALHVDETFGNEVAVRVVDDLERAFELLAQNPGAGHRRKDLTPDDRILFWSVGPTLIAYRAKRGNVDVLFVERGEVDWQRLLEELLE